MLKHTDPLDLANQILTQIFPFTVKSPGTSVSGNMMFPLDPL
jgi:hypothetical protein